MHYFRWIFDTLGVSLDDGSQNASGKRPVSQEALGFGLVIKSLRILSGMSQRQWTRWTGVGSVGTQVDLEHGRLRNYREFGDGQLRAAGIEPSVVEYLLEKRRHFQQKIKTTTRVDRLSPRIAVAEEFPEEWPSDLQGAEERLLYHESMASKLRREIETLKHRRLFSELAELFELKVRMSGSAPQARPDREGKPER